MSFIYRYGIFTHTCFYVCIFEVLTASKSDKIKNAENFYIYVYIYNSQLVPMTSFYLLSLKIKVILTLIS